MRNINQHLLNENQLLEIVQPLKDSIEGSNDKMAPRSQWDLLIPSETLFRRSSLILIIALGRQYTAKFHVRDLARSLNYDVSLISKNLKHLEKMGLVTHEAVGNLVFYQANMNSVLLRHMKICFTLLELNDLIRGIEPRSTNSILYGSCAKGEDTSTSDIDLFIETLDKEGIAEILDTYQKKLTRALSPIVLTPDETYTMKVKDKHLFTSIHQGIVLKGGENVP